MINKNEFAHFRKELKDRDNKREEVIQLSRQIIQLSKQIIYSVHRDDMNKASSLMKNIKKGVDKLKKFNLDFDTNINKVAFQEYVEAACIFEFVKSGKIPTRASLKVSTDNYLMGLCDLTGELVRKTVSEAINKNYKEVFRIKELVNGIFGEFLQFNLRNGELRKKSDSIKWNLKKIEEVAYDISMKRRK